MTTFLLLLFDHFFGRGILTANMPLLSLAVAAGVVEFHYKGWVQYCAVMALRDAMARAKKDPARKLSREQVVMGHITLFVGLLWDLVMMALACFYFLDLPREWTLSAKLDRLVVDGRWEWQRRAADGFRRRLLDNVDSRGRHWG